MNPQLTDASPSPQRPSWPWVAAFFLVLVGALAAVVAWVSTPPLNADEAMLVGTWYGMHRDPHAGVSYAWLAEQRSDRTMRLRFCNYYQVVPLPGEAPDSAWVPSEVEFTGRWSCRNRILWAELWSPEEEPSLLAKAATFLRTWKWPASTHREDEYQVTSLSDHAMAYDAIPPGESYHSIKVPPGFSFPDRPTPVEEIEPSAAPDPESDVQP